MKNENLKDILTEIEIKALNKWQEEIEEKIKIENEYMEEYIRLTKKLFRNFYISIDESLISDWYEFIKEYSIEEYEKAINKYITNENTIPYLNDILKLLNPKYKFL